MKRVEIREGIRIKKEVKKNDRIDKQYLMGDKIVINSNCRVKKGLIITEEQTIYFNAFLAAL